MPISAVDISEVQRLGAMAPDHDAPDLIALESIEEVIGYVVASARQDGDDEVEAVELVIRASALSANRVRHAESVLRRLGYISVADMMKRIAGRRKHVLAPLSH